VDPEARFERLFAAHAGAIRAYARRRSGPSIADDVVSDVFLVAWRRLDELPDDPLPWLLATARRVIANQARGDRRRIALRERMGHDRHATFEHWPGSSSDGDVFDALATLRHGDRELLLLVAWEGLEPARAAEALGIKPGTFAVRYHRARRRFAAALATLSNDETLADRSSIRQMEASP